MIHNRTNTKQLPTAPVLGRYRGSATVVLQQDGSVSSALPPRRRLVCHAAPGDEAAQYRRGDREPAHE